MIVFLEGTVHLDVLVLLFFGMLPTSMPHSTVVKHILVCLLDLLECVVLDVCPNLYVHESLKKKMTVYIEPEVLCIDQVFCDMSVPQNTRNAMVYFWLCV